MGQPLFAPRSSPGRRRPPWAVLVGLVLVVAFVGVAVGGYALGKRFQQADPWDPFLLRAYLDRPLDTSPPGHGFWIAGYYVDYDSTSLEAVKIRSNHMDQVVIFGYGFDRQGNLIGKDQLLIKGITGKQKRVLLFGNLTNGTFDKDTAHAILTDSRVQDRAVQNIIQTSESLGVAGVQIDFENIPNDDRNAYTAFLKRLKTELSARSMSLSIAAAAKVSDSKTGWGGATDYAAVGQIVDHFYIMAYDEHWRDGEPGPVASLPWVERVIRYATGVMPAQKIVLGVPLYGYEWGTDGKNNRAYGSSRMARRMTETTPQVKWDPVAGENVATYKTSEGDRIAWWPDQRSVDAKLRLAYQYNLRGVALWRLGFEPDDWWNQMGAFRVTPSK